MKDIILIILLQLVYVPMLALRTISMVKKLKVLTAFFGFLESIVYVFGLAIVLTGDQTIVAMLVYAIGFSLGLIVGIYIENKIAIGFTSVMVNIKDMNMDLITTLRQRGFGVTIFEGQGKDSQRYRLDILTKRTREIELYSIIDTFEPAAFVMSNEPTRFKGGYMEVMMKKQAKKFEKQIEVQPAEETEGWIKKTANEIVNEVVELLPSDQEIKD